MYGNKICYFLVFHLPIFFISQFSYSQVNKGGPQTYMGIRMGPNITKVVFNDPDYKKVYKGQWSPGYSAAMFFVFENKDRYALQTEVAYSMKGRRIKSSDGQYLYNKAQLHYIDMPAIFRMKFDHGGFQWYLGAGPELNYWLDGKGRFEYYDASAGQQFKTEYTLNFGKEKNEREYLNVRGANRLQLSFIGNIGFLFPLNDADVLGLDFRFHWGHSFLAKKSRTDPDPTIGYGTNPQFGFIDDYESTNNTVSVSFIYIFNFFQKKRQFMH